MVRSDVQLRRKTQMLANGSMQSSLNGFVNGMKAYVPNIILAKENETEEESIQNFIKEVNAGTRNVTGIKEGGEVVSWINPKTNTAETFTSTGSCIWGTSIQEATAAQKADMELRIQGVLARKLNHPEGTPVIDRVADVVTSVKTRLEAMREAAAATTLAAAQTEPVLS